MESTSTSKLASSLLDEPSPGVIEKSISLAFYLKQIDARRRDLLMAIKDKITFDELMESIIEKSKDRVMENIEMLYRKKYR